MIENISLSHGNLKIKSCSIFSLPSGSTCRPGRLCEAYCYTKKAERQYPAVWRSRARNFQESQKATFVDDMVTLLGRRKNKVVRIHEGGDFYGREYARKWFEIAKRSPSSTFYAYTKQWELFHGRLMAEKPSNFILIASTDGLKKDSDRCVGEVGKFLSAGFDKVAITHGGERTNCDHQMYGSACIAVCRKCIDRDKKHKVIRFKKH